jgi:hypothetical protein
MKNFSLFLFCFLALFLISCTVGRKVQLDKLVATVEVQGTKSVAIAVLDHRDHVLKEGKPQDFVGYLRSGVGIPYPIGTKTQKPFADDIASSINETLASKGFKCSVISTTPKDPENDIVSKLNASGAENSMLFTFNSWWTDTYMATLLNYNLSVTVFDKAGNQLVSKKFEASKKGIGANILGTEYKRVIPGAFKKELELILNDPEIKKNLQ